MITNPNLRTNRRTNRKPSDLYTRNGVLKDRPERRDPKPQTERRPSGERRASKSEMSFNSARPPAAVEDGMSAAAAIDDRHLPAMDAPLTPRLLNGFAVAITGVRSEPKARRTLQQRSHTLGGASGN